MNTIPFPDPSSHDLSLPAWGPYSKKYNGISHIPDLSRGIRFDLSVFPGYYRHRVSVPHTQWESGYHPWEAAPGLSYFSYRYDLEWKDQVYCDVAFFAHPRHGEAARLVRCEFVNNTDLPQHTVLHYAASLSFPPVRPYSDEAVIPSDPLLPAGARWIDALDYADLRYAVQRPSDSLVYEGWLRGEERAHGFVHGTGIGCGFGADSGDRVDYRLELEDSYQDALLLARYRAAQGAVRFRLEGALQGEAAFQPCDDFSLLPIPAGALSAGLLEFSLVSEGGAGFELDGFALVESSQQAQVRFRAHEWDFVPEIKPGPSERSLLLRYSETPVSYGLAWGGEHSETRQFFSSELDRTLRYFVIEHVQKVMSTDGGGHFTDVFVRPIVLPPRGRVVIYGLAAQGDEDEVARLLGGFDPNAPELEDFYAQARQALVMFPSNSSGEGYRFSQERMAATLLTNVVYPIYTRRSFIRHFTPGKRWDCLYTWDSGFISLGLQQIDLARGIDCLNAYSTPPGDEQAAFIHHGSPVPVQIYAFQELWNQTRSEELLRYFYPRLRQFYRFLAGRLGSSTTRSLQSGLLKTWDYFYNSAGWDDYPPQVYTHANHLEAVMTPVVTTAHAVRAAKILAQAAGALGLDADAREFQADIDLFSRALQSHAWDEEAGVFSYVLHDAGGQPREQLRHASGQNYNLGLDGISPFFAGVCTPEQEARILARIESSRQMWSPVGIVSVDQSAAYYRADGYWNGAVWFPYQWFLWKACLDLGYGQTAYTIAHTALNVWKQEVDETYQCFEHFIVASGRGTGWHHFGGLSAPILGWFNAYHRPGTLTCGFDTWIERLDAPADCRSLRAELKHSGPGREWLALAVLDESASYRVTWNGAEVAAVLRLPGVLEIPLAGSGTLEIQ